MNFVSAEHVFEMMNSHNGSEYLFGVDFELEQGFFITDPKKSRDVMWRVGGNSNFTPNDNDPSPIRKLESSAISLEQYRKMFDTVLNGILRGDSFLTNLTLKTPIDTHYSLQEIALLCNTPYLLMIPDRFVCFSPETFVRINDMIIESNPMKGTIDASIPNALEKLKSDHKEIAEHNTIVDLIRNDLSIVADQVRVEKFRYIDTLHTSTGEIIQTSSAIRGRLKPQYATRLGDALAALLPAGSVSGAPKRATLELINQAEQIPRGFYCGVFGYYDGKSLDSAVMIRYIEQSSDNGKYFRSGSGITSNSIADSEYYEVNKKIYLPFEIA